MLLLIAAWRKSSVFQTFSLVANYVLIVAGSLLFLMQMHDYSHSGSPEELAIKAKLSQIKSDQNNMTPVKKSKTDQSTTWKDTITITIPARGDKEYKFLLPMNATLEYSWKTDGESLFYDFHGEPTGDTTGYFESFKKNTGNQSSGSHTSTFAGTHGWYWKNNSRSPVVITLKAKGEYQRQDK